MPQDNPKLSVVCKMRDPNYRSVHGLHGVLGASISLLAAEKSLAVLIEAHVGHLDVAGVDILRANRGPLVMEVNASPGLEGIEKTTGIDIAGKMIRWIERHATTEYCLKTGG